MHSSRRIFKRSMAMYANDRRYRRAQNGYLLLILLLLVAMWPEAAAPGEESSSFELVLFLIRWMLPLSFTLFQLRLGLGLLDPREERPGEGLPVPRSAGELAATMIPETLHCLAVWVLQSPFAVAAVSAAGLASDEVLRYVFELLAMGAGARLAGLVLRAMLRRGGVQSEGAAST
mgnify:CR=1 FL=1